MKIMKILASSINFQQNRQFDDVEALATEICSAGLPNMPQDPNEYDQYLMHLFKNSKIMK